MELRKIEKLAVLGYQIDTATEKLVLIKLRLGEVSQAIEGIKVESQRVQNNQEKGK